MTHESRVNLWQAMVEAAGRQFPETGYIHHKTLEVVLLQADTLRGAVGLPANERRVASAPQDWIRIPRFDRAARERYGGLSAETLAAFAQAFFDAHDLPILVRPPEACPQQPAPVESAAPRVDDADHR